MGSVKVNKKHKDRLFCLIFGDEKYKQNTLALYNALNNTTYDDVSALELTTIEDVLYIGMKNDLSFIIEDTLNLYEQQSTYNPNMPLRGLLYFSKLYDKYLTINKCNIYGKTLIKIPTPNYVVLYNGKKEVESAVTKLKLSDAFIKKVSNSEFEWTATMYNLNHADNSELLKKCRPLYEYTCFIRKIQVYSKTEELYNAVNQAVEECIQENILKEFLLAHKAEVIDVTITEFNQEVYEKGIREEGIQEGIQQGIQQGLEQGLKVLVQALSQSIADNEKLYQIVIQNEEYKDKTREQVLKYL